MASGQLQRRRSSVRRASVGYAPESVLAAEQDSEVADTQVSSLVGVIADAHYAGLPWLGRGTDSGADDTPERRYATQVGIAHRRFKLRHPVELAKQGPDKAAGQMAMLVSFLRSVCQSGQWRAHRVRTHCQQLREAACTVQRVFRGHLTRRRAKMQRQLDAWLLADASDIRTLRVEVHRLPYVAEKQEQLRCRLTEMTRVTTAERSAAVVTLYRQRQMQICLSERERRKEEAARREQHYKDLVAAGIPEHEIVKAQGSFGHRSFAAAAAAESVCFVFSPLPDEDVQVLRNTHAALSRQWQRHRVERMKTGAAEGVHSEAPTALWSMAWEHYSPPVSDVVQTKIDSALVAQREAAAARTQQDDTPDETALAVAEQARPRRGSFAGSGFQFGRRASFNVDAPASGLRSRRGSGVSLDGGGGSRLSRRASGSSMHRPLEDGDDVSREGTPPPRKPSVPAMQPQFARRYSMSSVSGPSPPPPQLHPAHPRRMSADAIELLRGQIVPPPVAPASLWGEPDIPEAAATAPGGQMQEPVDLPADSQTPQRLRPRRRTMVPLPAVRRPARRPSLSVTASDMPSVPIPTTRARSLSMPNQTRPSKPPHEPGGLPPRKQVLPELELPAHGRHAGVNPV
eukprot:TRINITY_DN12446_c0_g1_i1.p1 TRINITY_DN12446_c0_g1~~TRINITY_DN12446_c0_g1_i1.p1  ORF type:complete len:654 (+),score=157.01 TRINITY_DN12446_c0_g1_i1:79-1962(+)